MTDQNRDLDREKWDAPALSSEVASGLLQCRLAMHAVVMAVGALGQGDSSKMQLAIDRYQEADAILAQMINNIGGLSGRSE